MYSKVGLIEAAVGTVNPLRSDKQGALVVTLGGGKYEEAVKQGNVYVASNQAAVAMTAALATTYTGLVLANPVGSGKNAVILRLNFSLTVVASAASVIGLMTGAGVTGIASAITPRNRLMGGVASSMIVDDGATLPAAPVLEQVFAQVGTLATTGTQIGNVCDVDLDGSLIVTPGNYVAVYSFAAMTAAAINSLMWKEVPV